MNLALPKQLTLGGAPLAAKLRGKGKLIAATCSAIAATSMAVFTFLSGPGGIDELSAADGSVNWGGPVGVLDSDYKHLVTVGKITRASRSHEYVAENPRDPMRAPGGALSSRGSEAGKSKAKAPEPATLPNMWLSGIIWDPENPIVMIDGLDLRVGDRIKGARVVEIRIDSVVLSYGSKEYVLTVD